MRMDHMILVSIDDHMIEPPDMYKNHVPAKWAGEAGARWGLGDHRSHSASLYPR